MRRILAVAGMLVVAGAAQGQLITFGFTDLAGAFNSGSGQFDAVVDGGLSSGDVSFGPGLGTAEYHPGFGLPADVSFTMTISNLTATTAGGSGYFEIVDADGDTIGGGAGLSILTGTWTDRGNGYTYFDGTLSRVRINDNGAQDGMFDGPSAGGFSIAGLTSDYWYGAVSFLMPTPANFFNADFSDNVTLVDGILAVPAPAGLPVLAGVGLVATRRRR